MKKHSSFSQEKPNNITIFFKIFLLPKSISVSIVCIKRQFQNSSKLSKRPRFDLIKGAFSAVTLQVATSNYPLQLFANDIFAIF